MDIAQTESMRKLARGLPDLRLVSSVKGSLAVGIDVYVAAL